MDPNNWHPLDFPRISPDVPANQYRDILGTLKVDNLHNFEPPPALSQPVSRFLISLVSSPLDWLPEDEADELRNAASLRLSISAGASARPALDRIVEVTDCLSVVLHEPGWTSDGIGLKTWGASLALARHIASSPSTLEGSKILELGAGTGLCGIVAAKTCIEKQVLMTDLPTVVDNLRLNATRSTCTNLSVGVLDWNAPESSSCCAPGDWPTVVAADPLYSAEAPNALAKTLEYLQARKLWLALPLRARYDDLRAELYDLLKLKNWVRHSYFEENGDDDFGPTRYAISVFKL